MTPVSLTHRQITDTNLINVHVVNLIYKLLPDYKVFNKCEEIKTNLIKAVTVK